MRLLPAMAHERSVVVAHGTLQSVAQSSEATERELGPRQLARAPGATIRVCVPIATRRAFALAAAVWITAGQERDTWSVLISHCRQHLDPHSLARCQLISRGVVGSNSSSTDWRDGSGSITYLLDCAPAQCELLVSALRAQSIHAEVMPASPPARAQSSGSLPAHRGSRSRSPRRRRSPGRSPPYHRHPLVDDAPSLQTLLVPQPPFDWAWAPRQKPVRPWAPPPPGPGQGTGGWR